MYATIYTVYKTTNKINNKIYIGKHTTINSNDSYLGSGLSLKNAIKKYGKENFTKTILFEYDNEKDAYLKENELVDMNFIDRLDTYNMCVGGKGAGSGKNNHMYGKITSDETKQKQRNFSTGRKLSKKSKNIISNKAKIRQIGIGNHQFNGYYITPWGKFETAKVASNELISIPTIRFWCKNNNNKINNQVIGCSKYLQSLNESPIGKTFKDIGFSFMWIDACKYNQKLLAEYKYKYITTWGNFNTVNDAVINGVSKTMIRNWCNNNHKIIKKHSITTSKYLQSLNESPIGKTFKDIGFGIIKNE